MKNIKMGKMKPKRQFSPMRAIMLLLLLGFAAGNAMAQYRVKPQHRDQPTDNGLYLDKQFKEDPDIPNGGSLFLESYVTGEVKKILASRPTDIVLVLDRSSSMDDPMASTYTYEAMTFTGYSYDGYGSHQYYYKDGEEYYRVDRIVDGTYNGLPSTGYSYDSYSENQYYHKIGNNYYLVTRNISDYTALPSAGYSYNAIINSGITYYYKDGENYWQVYGGQKNNGKYYLYYENETGTHQIGTDDKNANKPLYTGVLYKKETLYHLNYTQNNQQMELGVGQSAPNATIYEGVLYNLVSVYYRLYYTKNNQTIYLSGTTTTTPAPTDVTTSGETIWTGVLYNYTQGTAVKRIDALKAAVCTFIDMIAQDAEDHPTLNQYGNPVPVDHRISIVQFDARSQNVQVNGQSGLLNVVQNQEAMKSAVNAITTGSGTRQDLGLELALQNLLTPTLPLEKYLRKNVVVLFTDGEPYGQPTSGDVDEYDVCVNAAFPLKQNPTGESGNNNKAATVYSVGTYGNNPDANTINMMSYISSNYPNAVYMDNTGDPAPELKYSFTAESTESLQSVFELIAEESGGSTIDLGTETVIQDVISDYFQLPQDADGNPITEGIKVYTAQCIGVDEDHPGQTIEGYTYDSKGRAFGSMTEVTEEEGYHLRFSDDYTSIQIDGFDFKKNWCGLETDEGTPEPHGYKLILEIPIVPKKDAWGDAMPTNGALSVISKGEDITPDNIIDYFVSPTHTITRNTWVEYVKSKPAEWSADNIDSAEDLAWLISVVCGYNGQTAAPQTNATITADIDMSAYNWVPIGGTEGYWTYNEDGTPNSFVPAPSKDGYTGIFDGGGHSITGLRNQPSKVFAAGLFGKVNHGTIKNTFVMDCDFNTGTEGYFGIIADTLCNGGVIYNCEAAGQLKSCDKVTQFLDPYATGTGYHDVDPLNIHLGGLVGLVDNSEVHSCISVAELYGYNMGGLVNETCGNNAAMENSYSYPTFYHWFPSAGGNVGGMVAVNGGKLVNCYIRERESNAEFSGGIKYALDRIDDSAPHSKAEKNNGLLVGVNSGSASYLYMPDTWWPEVGELSQVFVGDGEPAASIGKFSITETPYMYLHKDNQVTMLSAKDGETQGLLATLNDVAWQQDTPERAGESVAYTSWFRTTADGINNDYPVLKIMAFNSVGSDDLIRLYYGDINHMMGSTSMYSENKDDDTYCIYQNAAVTTGNNDATLYINEDVAITQTENLDLYAYVGITLDNSAHAAGGGAAQNNPNDPTPHDYANNTRDWHMFSTSLSDAPLGVNYTDNNQCAFFYDNTPQASSINMPKYAFNDESVEDGYFPSHRYGKESDDEEYNYYKEWDYYCWSEPYNHWINFKRNSASHWAENIQTLNLGYTNETTLTPGKGYLLAIANETFLQSHGTLNQGDVTVPLTYSRMNEMSRGFNFVGNPYQSYLDFDAFAEENGIDSYTILDEDAGGYVTYAATGSMNSRSASQHISMHQGFLVYTDGSVSEVTFTEAMRGIEANAGEDVSFRGNEKASYTLVNLILTESDGKREIVTVETGRPEQGGARKMMGLLNGKSQLYAHCDGESYSVLFATDEMHTVPVRFRTYQDDSFTLTWDVENGSLDELYLVDNITGQTVDMLTHSQYVFEGRTTDFSSRFKLVFGNGTVDEPAEGEVIEDIFAYQNEDNLMVTSEGHFEMYDMSGRLVQCVNLYNDFNTVALPRMSRGVYTLRLTNNTDTKVQKIVIR